MLGMLTYQWPVKFKTELEGPSIFCASFELPVLTMQGTLGGLGGVQAWLMRQYWPLIFGAGARAERCL